MKAKNLPGFKQWLALQGAEILAPTNPYEIIRFRCKHGVGVVYQANSGRVTPNAPFVDDAYDYFTNKHRGEQWDGKGGKVKKNNKSTTRTALVARDGLECFYCGKEFREEELTQEHLLSLMHNGTNRIENKVLSCDPCNKQAGNMAIIEKIKLRDRMRANTESPTLILEARKVGM